MKKIISLFALAVSMITCKAQQQTYPLNTFYKDVPNYSYMKDLDNYLPPYVGTYKATHNGNEITLYITKEDHLLINNSGDRKHYEDVLHIKYSVKKISTGAILQDNINPIDPKRNKIISIGTNSKDNNSVELFYSGTNCGIGWGSIRLKKISNTQINWSYYPESTLLSDGECPASANKKIYLPETEGLIFTKQ